MKAPACLLLLGMVGSVGCAPRAIPTPESLTEACRKEFQKRDPTLVVESVRPLELRLGFANGDHTVLQLDTLWDGCRKKPTSQGESIRRFVQGALRSRLASGSPIDPTRIIPVVRGPQGFRDPELEPNAAHPGNDPEHHLYARPFVGDLTLHFLVLGDHGHRYLAQKDQLALTPSESELLSWGVANLRAAIPRVERVDLGGCFQVRAGHGLESALLFSDALWDGHQFPMKGDLVIALPAADYLLVSGTEEPDGLALMRKLFRNRRGSTRYPLSGHWLVRKPGRWEIRDDLSRGS